MTACQYAGAAILAAVFMFGVVLDYRDYKARRDTYRAKRDLAKAVMKK